jgi:hypothetical protein
MVVWQTQTKQNDGRIPIQLCRDCVSQYSNIYFMLIKLAAGTTDLHPKVPQKTRGPPQPILIVVRTLGSRIESRLGRLNHMRET